VTPSPFEVERLTEVDPRTIWPNEERDFTPWLGSHLDELSHAIGLELTKVEEEGPVGDFRADLVCEDVETNTLVVVENQLEESDHSHLGKLLVYAAGRGAKAVVWISPDFRDEHTQAIEWLNSLSKADVSFFAVRLRVLRIKDSPPAISLDVIAGPSEWQKTDAESALTPSQILRKEFFSRFLAAAPESLKGGSRKAPIAHWLGLSSGKSSFRYILSLVENRARAALEVETGDRDTTKRIFDRFHARRAELEQIFGGELKWDKGPDKLRSSIGVETSFTLKDRNTWDPAIAWSIDVLTKLKATFGPLIATEQEA
jgi:hypothetical protein